MTGIYFTTKHIEILKNAYGWGTKHPGERNQVFGDKTDKELLHLVTIGYLSGPLGTGWSEDPMGIFNLTIAGISLVKHISNED